MATDEQQPEPKYQIGQRVRPLGRKPGRIVRTVLDPDTNELFYHIDHGDGGGGLVREVDLLDVLPEPD